MVLSSLRLQGVRIILWLVALNAVCAAQDETIAFFDSGVVTELKLKIDDEEQQQLRESPREYVRCSLIEGDATEFKSIAVKLKGAAGSYQDFDDRPGLTLNVGKYKKSQRFHGMQKFHLNNAVQDESLVSEWLGGEVFRQAGYAAPRVGHVRLWINDRDLGLYVLREGFDAGFLQRSFGASDGNLYDGGFLQDIDSELEMDSGDDPDNRQDIVGLALACYCNDPAARKRMISERLDLDKFLTFMALERLCGHWDGYTLNMNNYRLYFPPNGKGVFLPHGMDQLFGDPGAGLYFHTVPVVAAAVMQDDELREMYRKRLEVLSKVLQPADRWLRKIDGARERLRPVLEGVDKELASSHQDRINELKERFSQRAELLSELIDQGMPTPIQFGPTGVVALKDWYPSIEADDVKVEEAEVDGVASYAIERDKFGDFSSSWRRQVLLPRGDYVVEARIRTEAVIPIPDDQGRGAGLRREHSGRTNELVATNDWTLVTYEIHVVEDQRMVELVLELRARLGKAWFDRESLKIRRVAARR